MSGPSMWIVTKQDVKNVIPLPSVREEVYKIGFSRNLLTNSRSNPSPLEYISVYRSARF